MKLVVLKVEIGSCLHSYTRQFDINVSFKVKYRGLGNIVGEISLDKAKFRSWVFLLLLILESFFDSTGTNRGLSPLNLMWFHKEKLKKVSEDYLLKIECGETLIYISPLRFISRWYKTLRDVNNIPILVTALDDFVWRA